MNGNIAIYLAVMAGVTYLVRCLPAVLVRNKINSKLLRGFLYYMPYAVLSAMTVPAVFYSTGEIISAVAGFAAAAFASLKGKSLIAAAVCACVTAYAVNFILTFI